MLERVAFVDNAKGALICLVVFGHVMGTAAEASGVFYFLFRAFALFRMPAFIILCGMVYRQRGARHTIVALLVPYSMFMMLSLVLFPDRVTLVDWWYLSPFWSLWFLVALCLWRLATPLVLKSRYPFLVTLGMTLAVGYLSFVNHYFTLARFFFFFPAFVFGVCYANRTVAWLHSRRVLSFAILLLLACASFAARDIVLPGEVFGTAPYRWTYENKWLPFAPVFRASYVLSGILAGVCFLALIPQVLSPLAWLGKRSMGIYMLHPLFVLPNEQLFQSLHEYGPLLALLAYCIISVGITAFCAVGATRLQRLLLRITSYVEAAISFLLSQLSRTGKARSYSQLKQNA